MHIFTNPKFDFVRWKWHAIALSWLVILAGVGYIWTSGGMAKGVEFSGGTIVIVKLDHQPNLEQIRGGLPGGGADAIVQSCGDRRRTGHDPLAFRRRRVGRPQQRRRHGRGSLTKRASARFPASCTSQRPVNCIAGTRIVGPTVGKELEQRGILATVFALGGILVYIALRFRFSFAVGAVVATIHDLLITLAFLAFFHYEMSLNVIAALLTITGNSMNDTIVIYDRIRENMRSIRRHDPPTINTAVNPMLDGRGDQHGGLAMLSVITLYHLAAKC
jgi:preprotein translocase subunit SecF